ncbi:MAG TPA: four helix bundle protein [Bryobacteraceae bacterium]|nr:four helix bundle protein [Bryobacteraceae bacterium]
MRNFRELKVWQKAQELAVYKATARFPREEVYGLTSQPRHAASSIPSNSAGGCGRTGDLEFVRFRKIACGAAHEGDYPLCRARDLNFLRREEHGNLSMHVDEVKRMLAALMKRPQPETAQL